MKCEGSKSKCNGTYYELILLCLITGNPKPVLTLSSLWLNPGASVTLTCSVEDPEAKIYWYRAIPRRTSNYKHENLICDRVEQNSCLVKGQTYTAAYVCGAKRDNAQNFTGFSKPQFVWAKGQYVSSIYKQNNSLLVVSNSLFILCHSSPTNVLLFF